MGEKGGGLRTRETVIPRRRGMGKRAGWMFSEKKENVFSTKGSNYKGDRNRKKSRGKGKKGWDKSKARGGLGAKTKEGGGTCATKTENGELEEKKTTTKTKHRKRGFQIKDGNL